MPEQNTDEMPEQVNEQNLQDITGGCDGCYGLHSLTLEHQDKALAKLRANPDSHSARTDLNKLGALGHRAMESVGKLPKEGYSHCENLQKLGQDVFKQIK